MTYLGQSFKQSLNTGIDLSSYIEVEIKYRTPSGIEGEWNASVAAPATDGIIYYEIPDGVLNETGVWQIWSLVINDSGLFIGDQVYLEVNKEAIRITNTAFVKSYLGITDNTNDDKIDALITLYEQLYLNIRNAPWKQGYVEASDESYNLYPSGANVTIAQMIGYKLSQGSNYDALTSENTMTYSWTSDGKTSNGFPAGIISQIKRYGRAI